MLAVLEGLVEGDDTGCAKVDSSLCDFIDHDVFECLVIDTFIDREFIFDETLTD
jgi:hypothetical protein